MNLGQNRNLLMQQGLHANGAVGSTNSGHLRALALIVLLAILATLPYINTLRNGFVYDDDTQVLANPYIRDFSHLREIFTKSVWSYLGDYRGATNYYRPVMMLGYLICKEVFGLRPFGFHLTSLILNAAVVCALFLLTRRMFGRLEIATLSAAVFALHPIHTEAVDWIAAVTELELALFYLLTFWFFLKFGVAKKGRSWWIQLGTAGSYLAALLSKEQALTFPLLATVYEHLYRDGRDETPLGRKVSRYAPLWALALAYLVVRIRLLGAFAPEVARSSLDGGAISLSALGLVGQYLWKLVWPVGLCAYYVFPELASILPWSLGGLMGLALCAGLFLLLWRMERIASFGLVWLLVTLAPVLNARWMPSNVFTERYLYLPSVGFCWIVGWAVAEAWRKHSARGRIWRYAFAAGVCLIGFLGTFRIVTRNLDWRDNVTLYVSTLKMSPGAYLIRNNLGSVYWRQGNVAAAEREWRKAEELAPQNELILNNLGMVAYHEQRYEEAAGYFLRALQTKANYSDAHLHLGETYEKMGLPQEAEVQLRTAVALSPLNAAVHNALGNLYFDQKRYLEAEDQYWRSVQTQPNYWGYWGLGFISWAKGDRIQAERFFRSAEVAEPSKARTHYLLGSLYVELGRASDAARELRTALQIDPNNAEALAALKNLESQAPYAKP
jgi:Tfp pilus assembly protein PilF